MPNVNRHPVKRRIIEFFTIALAFGPYSTQRESPGIERISMATLGGESNGQSHAPLISANGRYIAYVSDATNLVVGDDNGASDIFLYDKQLRKSRRISVSSVGSQSNGASINPDLSDSGRYVTFESIASNLVPGDTNDTSDVFVHDIKTHRTRRVSLSRSGSEGNGPSQNARISADGRFISFVSEASNLVPGDRNECADIFVRNLKTGVIQRLSIASGGTESNGYSFNPAISANGRFVAFVSTGNNLVTQDGNEAPDVFVHDRKTSTTRRISVSSEGREGNGTISLKPVISNNGRYVAFESDADNLVAADGNGHIDVFVYDMKTRVQRRVSVDDEGKEANNFSDFPSLSSTGRYVIFTSYASNLVAGDANNASDVFIHDLQTGTTQRVSVTPGGEESNGDSFNPHISANARHAVFDSLANNLIPADNNGAFDIFTIRLR